MKVQRYGLEALCLIAAGFAATGGYAGDVIGPIPNGGPPLRVNKNAVAPQHLDMSWGDSCGPDQNDFAVYEGTLGTWYSHTQKLCTTGGAAAVSDLSPQAASSYYLVVALSTTQEGSYGTNHAGVERSVGLTTCRAKQSTDACLWKRVFVSSANYSANLGGLAGADAACQALADSTQLGGTWKAFLSSTTTSAFSRLTHSDLSYRRVDGVLVAPNSTAFFSVSHANPISIDEWGNPVFAAEVWTGSGGSGVGTGGCADWTSASSSGAFPAQGLSSRSDSAWANVYLNFCDRSARLYCVEQ